MQRILTMDIDKMVARIRAERDEQALAGMARCGISVETASGMSVPKLRALGKEIVAELGRTDPVRHEFAQQLWEADLHETRVLAGLVDLPHLVTDEQMDAWVVGLDSWDVCDQLGVAEHRKAQREPSSRSHRGGEAPHRVRQPGHPMGGSRRSQGTRERRRAEEAGRQD
jgi:3-methyladenine DNA glycosylase AlkD